MAASFSTVSAVEASRRQPGMLEGLSRFLIQHERCGAGFDVAHPSGLGSGRVSITCRGCGARHEYATATIEFEREVTIEPIAPPPQAPQPPDRASIPPRPAPYPDSAQAPPAAAEEPGAGEPGPQAARRAAARAAQGGPRAAGAAAAAAAAQAARAEPGAVRRPLPAPKQPGAMQRFFRSPRGTTALVVIAAVALGFAVVRLVNRDSGPAHQASTQPGSGVTTATLPTPAPTATTPVPAPPTTPSPPPAAPRAQGTTLRTPHFAIEAPHGWNVHTASGGLLLKPGGHSSVNVQVYFQRSAGLSAALMSRQTARFLRNEVPGASLFRRRVNIGGAGSYELTARGPGETAIAVDVLRGPYRYLLVRRIFAGAKPNTTLASGRVVSSFVPR
jgi:hypothetical protein